MYGKPGVEALTTAMQSKQGLHLDDVKNVMENMATVEEYREVVLQALEQKGVIEKKRDYYVVDLSAIKELRLNQMVNHQNKKWQPFVPYIERGRGYALYLLFKDLKVVSKEDQQNKKQKTPKSLFYMPENTDQALDLEVIRRSDFYLGLWEIYDPKSDRLASRGRKKEYPCDKEALNMHEVTIAALIYHPKYGAGYRNEEGVLMIKNKKGQYVKFSAQALAGYGYKGGTGEGTENAMSLDLAPTEFIEKQAPNIFARHVLERTDIRQKSSPDGNKRVRGKKVYPTGDIMLDSIQYSLGRKFNQNNIFVHKLAPNLGGITRIDENGQERLTHTFNMVSSDDKRLRPIKSGKNKTFF